MKKSNVENEIYIPTLEVQRNGASEKDYYGVLYDGIKIEVVKGKSIRETSFTPLYSRKHVDALMENFQKYQADLLNEIPTSINVKSFEIVIEYVTKQGVFKELYRYRIQANADKEN